MTRNQRPNSTNATATSTLLKSFIHRLQEESIYDLLGAVLTDMPLPKYHNQVFIGNL
jgi:hypothetical protein